MRKEGYIVELTNKSKSEVLSEMSRILDGGPLKKLTVMVKYKTDNIMCKQKSCSSFQFLSETGLKVWDDENYEIQYQDEVKIDLETERKSQRSPIDEGIFQYEQGNIEKSLDIFIPLEDEFEKEKDKGKETMSIIENYPIVTLYIGNCYFKLKQYQKAIEYYEKQSGNDTKLKGQRMNNLGTCFAMQQEHQLSLKAFNQALKLYSLHPQVDCSGLYNNIGLIYRKSSMYSTAIEYFDESLKERMKKNPKQEKLYNLYFEKGVCLREMSKYEDSIHTFSLALNATRQGVGNGLNVMKEIAKIYEIQERWDEALTYYEKISDECERKNQFQGYVYERVAKIHEKIGNFHTSAKFLKKAFNEYRIEGNERKMSDLSSSIRNQE